MLSQKQAALWSHQTPCSQKPSISRTPNPDLPQILARACGNKYTTLGFLKHPLNTKRITIWGKHMGHFTPVSHLVPLLAFTEH